MPRAARASCTRSRASLRSRFCLADRSTSELSSGSCNEDHQSSFSIGVAAGPGAVATLHFLWTVNCSRLVVCPNTQPASERDVITNQVQLVHLLAHIPPTH